MLGLQTLHIQPSGFAHGPKVALIILTFWTFGERGVPAIYLACIFNTAKHLGDTFVLPEFR